jgi:hypothetical protein
MCTANLTAPPPPQKADDVPIGDGLAHRAKLAIQTRQRRIDEAVDQAQRGGPPKR